VPDPPGHTQEPPRHVVPHPDDAAALLRQLVRDGWQPREGFTPTTDPRTVHYGRVTDLDTAHHAARAAAHGAGLVVVADPTTDAGRTLLHQLRLLGPVHTTGQPADAVAQLVPEQRALLERLAAGDTIAAAAAAEFLSLRTANRRIADARAVLGVRTTRDAVLAYLRQRGAS
jgi:DNA-binding NarL/FixJ family response regulator